MDLDTGLIRAFVSVSGTLHFGESAAELFISQQGLSKRIAKLEEQLGVRLLHRSRRGVSLTAAGVAFLDAAAEIIDLLDAATAGLTGRTTLTVDVLDEHLSILPVIRALPKADGIPDLTVVMRGDNNTAIQMLLDGRADLSFGRVGATPQPLPSGIRARPVLAEQIHLLVPRGSELDRDEVTVAELAAHPLWFPTAGAPAEWTELLTEWQRRYDITVDIRGSTFGFDHWLAMVGDGTAPPSLIGSAMTLPPSLPAVAVPIRSPTPIFWWWAFWPRRVPRLAVEEVLGSLATALRSEPNVPVTSAALTAGEIWVPDSDRAFLAPPDPTPAR